MTNILLISNMYPSVENPSRGIFVKRMEEQLAESGFNVFVVSYSPPVCNSVSLKILRYIQFYLECVFRIVFSKNKITYVHFASHCSIPVLVGSFIRKICGRETLIVTNVHGGDIIKQRVADKLADIKKVLANGLLKRSNLIISPSRSFISEITSISNGSIKSKIVDVPSGGVDTSVYNSLGRNRDYGCRILFFARMDDVKRPEYTVRSLLHLYELHSSVIECITVGGVGIYGAQVASLIKESGSDDIEYLGKIQNENVPSLYKENDIYILLSSSESLGLTVLEAMASGMIVFVSNIPAFRDYIKHSVNGFIVSEDDSLSDCLSYYLKLEPSKRREIADNAIRTVAQNYSRKVSAERLSNHFRELLE